MKKIIIFPGQGYLDCEELKKDYVREFCNEHKLNDILQCVLDNSELLKNNKYSQLLIVAISVAQFLKFSSLEDDYIFVGFSLGEISSLIASKVISLEEGLNFVRTRGELCQNYAEKLSNVYTVGKVPYNSKVEQQLKEQQFEIINYVPDLNDSKTSVSFVGSNYETVIHFMKEVRKYEPLENLRTASLILPFHTNKVIDLLQLQKVAFSKNITNINKENLANVFNTRLANMYDILDKEDLNESLAQFLVSPIQTKNTLKFLANKYPNSDIYVTMGKNFIADKFISQCKIENCNGQIIDISNLI